MSTLVFFPGTFDEFVTNTPGLLRLVSLRCFYTGSSRTLVSLRVINTGSPRTLVSLRVINTRSSRTRVSLTLEFVRPSVRPSVTG